MLTAIERRNRLLKAFNRFKDVETCTQVLGLVKDSKQQHPLQCPHCESKLVVRHGKYRDRQRYKCKECIRTFNDFTNTPLHGTHYPQKWIKFVHCLIEGHSLYHTAYYVGISYVTAFFWRHKLIHALQRVENLDLDHIQDSNVYPYICVRQNPPLSYIEQKDHRAFTSWIRSFDWIARKYIQRYVAWFHAIQKIDPYKLLDGIQQMLISACSKSIPQTYKSVKMTS